MVAYTDPATFAEIGQTADAGLFVSDNAAWYSPVSARRTMNSGLGEEHVNRRAGFLSFLTYGRGQVVATSNKGATMADKSPGKSLRKPALSIKERRAAKRAKVIESTSIARKRKR